MASNARQEILVICLVESSVTVLHEWSDILLSYVSPLLQRIASAGAAKGTRNELRIGFVSYSDPYVHPNPILARRFFSPVIQLTKELKDDPASLGIGRTASGGRRGMAVLEGYVAVLEMFDAINETRLPPPPPPLRPHLSNEAQQEPPRYDPTCYLIHVASSPPDKATRPSWNTNIALDTISWASLPSELLKRKIRCNMILTRPILELLDLYKHITRAPEPSWLNLLKPSHKLLFSGLPPKDTKIVPQKRAATEHAEPQQQSAPPLRPPSQEQATTVNLSAVTATPSGPPGTIKSSPSRPGSVTSAQPSIESHVVPQPQPQPQPQPPTQLPSQPQPHPPVQPQTQTQPQLAQPRLASFGQQNIDPAKLMTYIRGIENDCRSKLAAVHQARAAGKPQAELDVMQAELNQKVMNRTKLIAVYQQVVQRQQLNDGNAQNQTTTASNDQPVNLGQLQQVRPPQEQPDIQMQPSNAGASGQSAPISQPQGGSVPFANFGGPNLTGKNPFQNLPISARSGMEAQMQKMLAERTRPPVLAAAPQTQPQSQPPAQNEVQPVQGNPTPNLNQPQSQSLNPTLTTSNPNIADIMTPRASLGAHLRRWQGALAWPTGPANAGVRRENQLTIALFAQDANLRPESWPQKLILQPSRCPFNMQQIQGWNKELNATMALISPTPILGNFDATAQNARLFRQLKDLIQHKNLLAYCKFDIAGGPPGTGFLTFPMNLSYQSDLLVAMVFHRASIPAALISQAPPTQVSTDPVNPTEVPPAPQAMNSGASPVTLQNMSPEAKAFLQQRQAAALAAYNQQQLAQQQAQQKGLIPNSGSSSAGPGPSAPFNVAQFMHGIPQASGENQIGLGGLNLPQTPALQQVQHRQPSGFNPGQIGSLQMLQYAMNRRPDEGQGQ